MIKKLIIALNLYDKIEGFSWLNYMKCCNKPFLKILLSPRQNPD